MALLDIVGIQYGEEAVFGTEVASYSTWPGQNLTASPVIKKGEELVTDIGTQEEALLALYGASEYGVTIEFRAASLIFLYWVLGTLTSETGTDPYTHTIDPGNTIPSLSIEVVMGNGDFSIKFLGCKVDQCVITAVLNEPLKAALTFKAKSASVDVTPGTATVNTTVPFEFDQVTTFTINGVDYKSVVERAQYTFARNVTPDHSLSSQDPTTITEGKRGWVASYDIRPPGASGNGEDLYNLLFSETDFAVSHVMQRAGGVNDQLTITGSNAKVFDVTKKSEGGGKAFVNTIPVRFINGIQLVPIDAIVTYTNPV